MELKSEKYSHEFQSERWFRSAIHNLLKRTEARIEHHLPYTTHTATSRLIRQIRSRMEYLVPTILLVWNFMLSEKSNFTGRL